MTQPHITQFSTDEEFAAYAMFLDQLTTGLDIHDIKGEDIGYLKASTYHFAQTFTKALEWRREQRTMLRELSEQRRSERRELRQEP
jgi:hypothetical protein